MLLPFYIDSFMLEIRMKTKVADAELPKEFKTNLVSDNQKILSLFLQFSLQNDIRFFACYLTSVTSAFS